MNIETLKGLAREIEVKDNGILLKTEGVGAAQYAFYLNYSGSIKKSSYSGSTSHFFENMNRAGCYIASFYYKKGIERILINVVFLLEHNGVVRIVKKIELASNDKFKIDYYDNKSDTTFIVFNGTKSKLTSSPFGLQFLLKSGYNVIACLQNDDQYQNLSFDDFKRCVEPITLNKKIFLYGASLGGYCALYYAGAVNGNVIASAPKNSAHPKLIEAAKGKTRFKDKDFKHTELTANPISQGRIYIFIDPYQKFDVFFLNEWAKPAYPNLKLLKFEYAGHKVLMHVNRTKQLKKILDNIVNDADDLEIDFSKESIYTDVNRAIYFYQNKQLEQALFFANRALESAVEGEIENNVRIELEAIRETASDLRT